MAWSSCPPGAGLPPPGGGEAGGAPGARARADALRYLAARPYTAVELRQRLLRRGHPEEAVEAALAWLAGLGYLDDAAYARHFVDAHSAGPRAYGPRRLAAELRRRGVAPEVIGAALAAGPDGPAALDQAVALAQARLARMAGLPPAAARRRLAAFLLRRGYDGATVARALRHVLGDAGDGPDPTAHLPEPGLDAEEPDPSP